jgi:hypothetical protein
MGRSYSHYFLRQLRRVIFLCIYDHFALFGYTDPTKMSH